MECVMGTQEKVILLCRNSIIRYTKDEMEMVLSKGWRPIFPGAMGPFQRFCGQLAGVAAKCVRGGGRQRTPCTKCKRLLRIKPAFLWNGEGIWYIILPGKMFF